MKLIRLVLCLFFGILSASESNAGSFVFSVGNGTGTGLTYQKSLKNSDEPEEEFSSRPSIIDAEIGYIFNLSFTEDKKSANFQFSLNQEFVNGKINNKSHSFNSTHLLLDFFVGPATGSLYQIYIGLGVSLAGSASGDYISGDLQLINDSRLYRLGVLFPISNYGLSIEYRNSFYAYDDDNYETTYSARGTHFSMKYYF